MRVLERLSWTQKSIANNPNDFLLQLERKLIEEYSLILLQEEEYWALKSRLNTTTFGDKNTAFFHVSTVVRIHRNKIRCIRDKDGESLYEEDRQGHIRPLLNNLILLVQSAFVPRRRGLDNVLIAQDLIYAMDRKKGKTGYMAITIDLENTYDRLEWSFIYKTFQAFHFSQNTIKLIVNYISSTSISILVNGGKLDSFAPSHGIR